MYAGNRAFMDELSLPSGWSICPMPAWRASYSSVPRTMVTARAPESRRRMPVAVSPTGAPTGDRIPTRDGSRVGHCAVGRNLRYDQLLYSDAIVLRR